MAAKGSVCVRPWNWLPLHDIFSSIQAHRDPTCSIFRFVHVVGKFLNFYLDLLIAVIKLFSTPVYGLDVRSLEQCINGFVTYLRSRILDLDLVFCIDLLYRCGRILMNQISIFEFHLFPCSYFPAKRLTTTRKGSHISIFLFFRRVLGFYVDFYGTYQNNFPQAQWMNCIESDRGFSRDLFFENYFSQKKSLKCM